MLIDGIPELSDYRLTVEEAELMQVPTSKKSRTLGWFAKHAPARLDRFLDNEKYLGSLYYYAVILVNEKYEKRIAEAVNAKNLKLKAKHHARRYDPFKRKMILPSILHGDYFKNC